MEILDQYSAYPESYQGIDGCLSILRQNCISAEQTEFPFRFKTNLMWSQQDIDSATSQINDYIISFDENSDIFTIDKIR